MEKIRYNIVLRPEKEGGFTVMAPSLPGCITYGRTLQEAKEMIADAIKGYLISLKKHKQPIPNDGESFFASIDVKKSLTYA
ncbi:antitoxin HicB [bacterium (Candidatus Gribaldobacteria) CG23_combo_of_CG06-09_8_20_14_all_37_87_8]|uniref:Antitoxin HicB n=2 Tax=Candidatus Gribaldobacteria TaxID=2798536 RepID=A0A2G9ZF79_9BACT|nr:MAG: hypothetical protein AUJ25_02845 [Parcubacteria group bacterium CG1_02_37_13]PIP31823.1 MAG: antitoxin HicB [bacterium (Candidatus Gribaldobacteria) CG23_combo_of_CG06-09_8_20_14_all_37_87_8]PIR90657.1 MAG: antitoxin HicB [bacterium (Candidatus Gribaldobacteria) CG10_big_fil_rev_8_21_14_0_10_37_21]